MRVQNRLKWLLKTALAAILKSPTSHSVFTGQSLHCGGIDVRRGLQVVRLTIDWLASNWRLCDGKCTANKCYLISREIMSFHIALLYLRVYYILPQKPPVLTTPWFSSLHIHQIYTVLSGSLGVLLVCSCWGCSDFHIIAQELPSLRPAVSAGFQLIFWTDLRILWVRIVSGVG